jgi:hypothetical protein
MFYHISFRKHTIILLRNKANIIFLVFYVLWQSCIIYSCSNYIMSTYIDLQLYGTQFAPINQVEFISTLYNVESLTFCATLCCSHNSLCRTFDYSSTDQCRLFEGDISTGTVHNFLQSIVGAIVYYPTLGLSLSSNYNHTCMNNCDSEHYFVCNNLTQRYQCPSNTFWNGTFCVNQLYTPSTCAQSN